MTDPSPGLPAFVSVGYVDGELIDGYDSETQRAVPGAAWMEQEGQDHWDRQTQNAYGNHWSYRVELDTLQERYNQSGGYHTVQCTYGCDLLEDGGIWGFLRDAYDGKDFIAFDKDTLTFVTAYAAALITKRDWEAENEPERLKHYLEKSCIEWQRRYMEYGRAALERRGGPAGAACSDATHPDPDFIAAKGQAAVAAQPTELARERELGAGKRVRGAPEDAGVEWSNEEDDVEEEPLEWEELEKNTALVMSWFLHLENTITRVFTRFYKVLLDHLKGFPI
ncbi:class I histocompatibility antigen, F10 alpha chain-like [Dromaius novaehollandiae]|uniref:class I histocompatibility antigen, F10 alpha chain-like n=1 Tax=Dromaius novaehollandiae TaxID=8790 RepID=UPI00311D7801